MKIREDSWLAEQGFGPQTPVCTKPIWFWLRQLRRLRGEKEAKTPSI